jgi:hypothetical protein
MELADRMARDCASERQRMIEGVCDLAGKPELAVDFVASDKSASAVLRELLHARMLDELHHDGAGAVLQN